MVELDLMQAYAALFTMAIIPIIIGSFKSLNPTVVEVMTSKDAYLFPVIGSGVLFSLYLCFKFLPKDYVNLIMSSYFMLMGVGAITTVLHPLLKNVLPTSFVFRENSKKEMELREYKFGTIQLPKFIRAEPIQLHFYAVDLVGGAIASIVGVVYVVTKHWIANNILGESFSMLSIELMSLGSFKVGSILLIGLFFYDIFWVFGTDVMVTVAKSFDAPIKVVWPRGESFSLLGLGDIVIPGIFVALMLRFDQHLAIEAQKKKGGKIRNNKVYFYACFTGYIIGLVTTITVLHVFRRGQPALLYIVPGCLGAVLITAAVRGELPLLWSYEEKQKEEATPAEASKQKTN